jgi:hypothetical protein
MLNYITSTLLLHVSYCTGNNCCDVLELLSLVASFPVQFFWSFSKGQYSIIDVKETCDFLLFIFL